MLQHSWTLSSTVVCNCFSEIKALKRDAAARSESVRAEEQVTSSFHARHARLEKDNEALSAALSECRADLEFLQVGCVV